MKKTLILSVLYLLTLTTSLLAQEVVGFWKTIDDKTGQPQSLVAIYEYQGKYYGRLLATYDNNGQIEDTIYAPKKHAPGVKGNPYYVGLDFMWDLKPTGSKFADGHILDPQEGKIYTAEMWLKGDSLMVRGEIWVFGRNQTWPPALDSDFPPDFKKPDLAKLIPSIPEPNDSES